MNNTKKTIYHRIQLLQLQWIIVSIHIYIDVDILSSKSSLLMSLESQLNHHHQQQTSNKRIKSEPLDLHQHYSNSIQIDAGGSRGCQSMSPFV
ncbi:hypothetical protein BLA29_009966 [Euroglyphus maynei]|uniref:Uncharacterized protein n=1 Tax=Euroglyphus maynei TaxID=6958 RepID=A0A1Y3B487_EURMA|nr:hypothetical protein BLA29_009966 [Euroglyphus maynei]